MVLAIDFMTIVNPTSALSPNHTYWKLIITHASSSARPLTRAGAIGKINGSCFRIHDGREPNFCLSPITTLEIIHHPSIVPEQNRVGVRASVRIGVGLSVGIKIQWDWVGFHGKLLGYLTRLVVCLLIHVHLFCKNTPRRQSCNTWLVRDLIQHHH